MPDIVILSATRTPLGAFQGGLASITASRLGAAAIKGALAQAGAAPAAVTDVLMGNVLQSLNGSVNAIWVGSYLGTAALTATNNSNIVMFLLLGAVFGFTMASTILVAQSVGAGKMAEAKRVVE